VSDRGRGKTESAEGERQEDGERGGVAESHGKTRSWEGVLSACLDAGAFMS